MTPSQPKASRMATRPVVCAVSRFAIARAPQTSVAIITAAAAGKTKRNAISSPAKSGGRAGRASVIRVEISACTSAGRFP